MSQDSNVQNMHNKTSALTKAKDMDRELIKVIVEGFDWSMFLDKDGDIRCIDGKLSPCQTKKCHDCNFLIRPTYDAIMNWHLSKQEQN